MPPIARVNLGETAKALMEGDLSTQQVVRKLREAYPDSMHTVTAKMSNIRALVLAASSPMDATALLALEEDPPESMLAFANASRAEQYAIQRQHNSTPSWSSAAESMLASLDILPPCVKDLVLTKRESNAMQRAKEEAVKKSNMNPYLVEETDKLLFEMEESMRNAKPTDSWGGLAIPILLATGRRTAEIMDGKSQFQPIEGEPYHGVFTGQKKTRDPKPFIIPILVPFPVLANAMNVLRSKQGHVQLTSKESKNKYQSTLGKQLKVIIQHQTLALPKEDEGRRKVTIHALRKIYVACVARLFDCPFAFNATAMRACCHNTIKDSLAYSCVKLKGISGECRLGRMIVDALNASDESDADSGE